MKMLSLRKYIRYLIKLPKGIKWKPKVITQKEVSLRRKKYNSDKPTPVDRVNRLNDKTKLVNKKYVV